MLLHHMTLVSFRLLRKKLGNLREFLGKWLTAPPGKKLAVRLCVPKWIKRQSYYDIVAFSSNRKSFADPGTELVLTFIPFIAFPFFFFELRKLHVRSNT